MVDYSCQPCVCLPEYSFCNLHIYNNAAGSASLYVSTSLSDKHPVDSDESCKYYGTLYMHIHPIVYLHIQHALNYICLLYVHRYCKFIHTCCVCTYVRTYVYNSSFSFLQYVITGSYIWYMQACFTGVT